MKKQIALMCFFFVLISISLKSQQQYDTVIYYPQQIIGAPKVWSSSISWDLRHWYCTFSKYLFGREESEGCLVLHAPSSMVVSTQVCNRKHEINASSYDDTTLLQMNGFAQPYHLDSTVTIIGVAAQLCGMYRNCEDSVYCFYGSAENDSLWTHSIRRFNIQDTNLTVVYDYKDIPRIGYTDSVMNISTEYNNYSPYGYRYDSTLTAFYFRNATPIRLKDFCLSVTIDGAPNIAILERPFNHTFSWYDPNCSGETTENYTGYSPYFRWGKQYGTNTWVKFSDDSIYAPYSRMHIMFMPIILKAHNASLTQVAAGMTCSVFPNPAQDKLTVNREYKVKEIIVTDISGKEVLKKELNSYSFIVDIHKLKEGSYIIQLDTQGGIARKKFVIER